MKLHLPKLLLTAVLAVMGASATWGLTIDTSANTAKEGDSWTMTFAPTTTTYYTSEVKVKEDSNNTQVIGANGKLFVQTWSGDGCAGDVDLLGDIYVGKNEGIRVGMDNYNVNLKNIYLTNDSSIYENAGNTSHTVNISGTITDKVPTMNGGETYDSTSTFTFNGGKYNITGTVDTDGLAITKRTFSNQEKITEVTFAAGSTLILNSTLNNEGVLTLNGTVMVNDLTGFESSINAGSAKTATINGLYDAGITYAMIKGNAIDANSGTTTVKYNDVDYNIADGIEVVVSDKKAYAIVEGDKTVTLGGTNATEEAAGADCYFVNGGKLAIAAGDYDNIFYASGSIDLAKDASMAVASGNISTMIENSTGTGTYEIESGVTSLIAGSSTGKTYDFAGTLSVKSGGKLELSKSGEGSNDMAGVTLAKATIDMNGGTVRYFGGDSTIGTIKVTANSTFDAYATNNGDTNQGTVTINTLDVDKVLTITGQWESNIHIKSLTLDDTMTLNADSGHSGTKSNVTIDSLSGNGMLQMLKGSYTLSKGTHSINRIDASNQNNNTGTLNLAAGANVTVTSNMWLGTDDKTSIKLGNGASLTRDKLTVIGTNNTAGSSISRTSAETEGNVGDTYNIDNVSYVIKNANVEVKAGGNGDMISNRLVGVSLTNTGSGTLSASNGYNNYTALIAQNGNLNIGRYGFNAGWNAESQTGVQQGELLKLVIGAGKTVGVHTGWNPTIDAANEKATVTVNGTATFGKGANLYANLELVSGTALTLDGALAMNAGTLTLGESLTLDAATLQKVMGLQDGDTLDLFTNVSSLVLGEVTYAKGTNILDATTAKDLSNWFTLTSPEVPAMLSETQPTAGSGYYLGYNAEGTVYVGKVIPEPTTATLSLLALAGLAARRRRK